MGAIDGSLRSDELRFQPKHQAGFSLTSMQTTFQLLLRQERSEIRNSAPEKTGQHCHGRTAGTQLPRRDLQQPDLPTVGVEQQKPTGTDRSQLPTHLIHKLEKQISRQRQGAWESLVFR